MTERKLGLEMMSLTASLSDRNAALLREAEELGYTSLWVPEVSGHDAFVTLAAYAIGLTVLAWWLFGTALKAPLERGILGF